MWQSFTMNSPVSVTTGEHCVWVWQTFTTLVNTVFEYGKHSQHWWTPYMILSMANIHNTGEHCIWIWQTFTALVNTVYEYDKIYNTGEHCVWVWQTFTTLVNKVYVHEKHSQHWWTLCTNTTNIYNHSLSQSASDQVFMKTLYMVFITCILSANNSAWEHLWSSCTQSVNTMEYNISTCTTCQQQLQGISLVILAVHTTPYQQLWLCYSPLMWWLLFKIQFQFWTTIYKLFWF